MQKISKLIIFEWLKFFIGSMIIMLTILTIGHFLNAIMKDSSHLKSVLSTFPFELPPFFIKITPVSCLTASLFSINKFKKSNELVAIFASGFSRIKFIFHIFILGSLVGLFLFFINSYVIPKSSHKLNLLKNEKSTSTNTFSDGRIWFKGLNYFFSYNFFNSKSNTISNLEIYYFNKDFQLTEEYKAKEAVFDKENVWNLKDVIILKNLSKKNFPLIEQKDLYQIQINETLNDFSKINIDIKTMNIWKLYEYILVLKNNGINYTEYFVSFLDKFSSGLTCLMLSLIASTGIFNPNRRNSSFGLSVAYVLSFTFFYWFIYSYFFTLGQNGSIPAVLATFGVPSLFLIYLIFYFFYHRKLR